MNRIKAFFTRFGHDWVWDEIRKEWICECGKSRKP